jgi:hypothetical protein
MAKADRAPLTPEECAARCVLERHGVKVPVKIENIVSLYADLEEDEIPVTTDGIVLHHPKMRSRPLIVLNRRQRTTEARRRFTLAHELGHLLIGWHPGTIACNLQSGQPEVHEEHVQFEAEANRFASEFLMPSNWIQSQIDKFTNIKDLHIAVMKTARVSCSAARIKLLRCLEPGYVCVEVDERKNQFTLDTSDRGYLDKLVSFDEKQSAASLFPKLDKYAVDGCVIKNNRLTIRWWRLDYRAECIELADVRHSTEILEAMLEDCELQDKAAIKCSLNGKIGAANFPADCPDKEALYGTLKLRFERPDIEGNVSLRALVSHPEFQVFLQKKSEEIIDRRRMSR